MRDNLEPGKRLGVRRTVNINFLQAVNVDCLCRFGAVAGNKPCRLEASGYIPYLHATHTCPVCCDGRLVHLFEVNASLYITEITSLPPTSSHPLHQTHP